MSDQDDETKRMHARNQNEEILSELRGMRRELSEIKQDLARGETLFAQFAPVPAIVAELKTQLALQSQEMERLKSLVYGAVGLILVTFLGAIAALVIKSH